MTPAQQRPNAMVFPSYCSLAGLDEAAKYAGEYGHVADMYDTVDAKIRSKFKEIIWKKPVTTTTGEYFWKSRTGIPIIIVAHGVGPLATPDGARRAYNNKHVIRSEGRVSPREFRKLENGHYGDLTEVRISEEKYDKNVHVAAFTGEMNLVILDKHLKSHRRPFSDVLTFDEAVHDVLVHARIGEYSDEFLECLCSLARDELKKVGAPVSSCIIKNSDSPNCRYELADMDYPIAHLLDISATEIVPHEHDDGKSHHDGLITEISCHEKWADSRFIGMKSNDIATIHPGIEEAFKNIEANWKKLLVPAKRTSERTYNEFYSVVKIGNEWFTQYPNQRSANVQNPQFRVVRKSDVPGIRIFMTAEADKPEFTYDMQEVRKIAPEGANAYNLDDARLVDGVYEAPIRFYKIEADISQRILRADEVRGKPELIESLTA